MNADSTDRTPQAERKRSMIGCAVVPAMISVMAFAVGIYLLRFRPGNIAAATIAIVVGVLFVFPVVMVVWIARNMRNMRKKLAGITSAKNLIERNKKLYVDQHDYRPATVVDFQNRDQAWYASMTHQLTGMGYFSLGDLVNQTVERATGLVVISRRFVSADRTSMSSIYQVVRPNKKSGAVRDLRICEFESELAGGDFIMTSNAEAAKDASLPPQIHATWLSPGSSPAELSQLHEESKRKCLDTTPERHFTRVNTLDEYLAAQARMQAIKAGFRKEIGYVDLEEVRRIAEKKWPEDPEKVAAAVAKFQIARRLNDPGVE